MDNQTIIALKACVEAIYIREHGKGINTHDAYAKSLAIAAIKANTGELYASGEWFKDEWGNKAGD